MVMTTRLMMVAVDIVMSMMTEMMKGELLQSNQCATCVASAPASVLAN